MNKKSIIFFFSIILLFCLCPFLFDKTSFAKVGKVLALDDVIYYINTKGGVSFFSGGKNDVLYQPAEGQVLQLYLDGGELFFAESFSNTVRFYSLSEGQVTKRAVLPAGETLISFSKSFLQKGELWFLRLSGRSVGRLSLRSGEENFSETFPEDLRSPQSVALLNGVYCGALLQNGQTNIQVVSKRKISLYLCPTKSHPLFTEEGLWLLEEERLSLYSFRGEELVSVNLPEGKAVYVASNGEQLFLLMQKDDQNAYTYDLYAAKGKKLTCLREQAELTVSSFGTSLFAAGNYLFIETSSENRKAEYVDLAEDGKKGPTSCGFDQQDSFQYLYDMETDRLYLLSAG